jgi:CheY-like chemotaxis protein
LQEETFNLNNLLDHLNLFFSQETKKKHLEWKIQCDSNIHPIIFADKVKINQVLINLINNAIKFTNEGSVQLKISLLNKTKKTQRILFEVIDTGIGISSSFKNKIFTDFAQESDEISSQFGGTGLGLAISNKIVSNMGGNIQFNSEKKKGSTFYFELEFDLKNEEFKDQLPSKVELISTISIAIAEDNPLNQLLLKSIFNKTQINYAIVGNGQELIDLILKERFDIVLLDVQMPIMDGIETIKAIRNKYKSDIPVIALTANASQEDKRNYLDLGMNGVLSKPFIQDELFALINELVGTKKGEYQKNDGELSSNDSSYSMNNILTICDGDTVFLTELLKTLVENTSRLVTKIQEDAKLSDAKSVAFSAHQLKSTLRSIEANEALQLVLEIEANCEPAVNFNKLNILASALQIKIIPILNSISETYLSSPSSK